MKKVVIIGTAVDVTAVKRGDFLTKNFDEIVILNKSIFHLQTHKEYIGTPTIWGCCGWYSSDPIFDPSVKDQEVIESILQGSNIKEVWLNTPTNIVKDFNFKIPNTIEYTSICEPKIKGHSYHSLGLQSILYSIERGYNTYYLGIDSYRKSHHYYEEDMPSDILDTVHLQSHYMKESRIIKELIKEGKLNHINTLL